GRLSRTSAYVTATTYGAMPEVHNALEKVRMAHIGVEGVSHRARPYTASGAMYASWVHNALSDSFLAAYEAYGAHSLTSGDADRYVTEQARLGALVKATELPQTRTDLARWIATHPDAGPSPGMEQAVAFLRNPPLPPTVLPVYGVLFHAAAATVPSRIAQILGVRRFIWARPTGDVLTAALRWSLGASPSWWLALERTRGAAPSGVRFLRPPPTG
ncbi:MAG: oxygenase MpaB family protein, partial [Actinomycetota bacterium]